MSLDKQERLERWHRALNPCDQLLRFECFMNRIAISDIHAPEQPKDVNHWMELPRSLVEAMMGR